MTKGVSYTGVCVVFFCHDGAGRFLMAKRNENCRDEYGRWDIGGGGLDFGETLETALAREIKEEYCTSIISHQALGFRDIHRTHEDAPTHWIALDYAVQIDPSLVANGEPHKHDAIEWFTLDSMPLLSEVHSQWPAFYNAHQKRLLQLTSPVPIT